MLFNYRKYPLMFNADWDNNYGGGGGYTEIKTIIKDNYIATDGNYIYSLSERPKSTEFKNLNLDEPKIKLSNFDGCPHWYGIMFIPDGRTFELQCKITKKYLEEAHSMKGDWTGYKEGDLTNRFLGKSQIMSAFNLFKILF